MIQINLIYINENTKDYLLNQSKGEEISLDVDFERDYGISGFRGEFDEIYPQLKLLYGLLLSPGIPIKKFSMGIPAVVLFELSEFTKILKYNTIVTHLFLSSNHIGDEGTKEIGKALEVNIGLTILDLGYNEIGDFGTKALAESLKSNSSLTINLSYKKYATLEQKQLQKLLKIMIIFYGLDLMIII